MSLSWTIVALTFLAQSSAAEDLLEPVPIQVGGQVLDVEHAGQAAPFVGDFDGDGKKDLLVGEGYKGRLRMYRNVGTNESPKFESFSLLHDGAPSGCVRPSSNIGFGPQLVDLDGDGHQDIISGDWAKQINLFRGQADGSFAAGEPLRGLDGKMFRVGYGITAFAVDWDADGDLDLLAGTMDGTESGGIHLILNERAAGANAFRQPELLHVDGKPAVTPGGNPAPVAADWDGDGKLDLIVGCGNGSVLLYRNIGPGPIPELAAAQLLVGAAPADSGRGKLAKICVTDWNQDGRLDLLVGDLGDKFEKTLTPAEESQRAEARRRQEQLLKEWGRTYRIYRKLLAAEGATKEGKNGGRNGNLDRLRSELITLKNARNRYYEEEQALQTGTQSHGRVWLYLRSAF